MKKQTLTEYIILILLYTYFFALSRGWGDFVYKKIHEKTHYNKAKGIIERQAHIGSKSTIVTKKRNFMTFEFPLDF